MLREQVKPLNYKLNFDVDFKSFRYFGDETIQIEIKEETDKIILHTVDLEITRCKIILKDETLTPKTKIDKDKEELALQFEKKISTGNYELYIAFEGKVSDSLAGFYKSRYTTKDGEIKYIATTQFEPADARRMFPCFDEPAFKATFELSVTADKKFEVISNMPIAEEKQTDKSKKSVRFEKTPPMSTYLFYLGIGEFEFLEDTYNGVALRFACTKGKKKQGAFAIDIAKKFLAYYDEYFGMPYTLPKLDLIAIPDFSSGAMENWGAITFREARILFDAKTTSIANKQAIADVVAHELVHQWFGDLVTMKWWNDLWLNESFATWLAYKAIDKYFPEWDIWSQFLVLETAGGLALDSLKSSHPIDAEVKTPHEVNEIFDAISYNKGGSVLRMLESYLGEDIFKTGLQKYIAKHKYANATTQDLWTALEDVSKAPVVRLMSSWTKQSGYPIIEAELKENKVKLTQKRFLLEQVGKANKTKWIIPISILTDSGEKISFLLEDEKKEILLKQKANWIKLNTEQTGFYRTKYEKNILDALKTPVKEKKIGCKDRWGLQNDLYMLARASEIKFSDYADFVKAYENEDDFVVCSDIAGNFYTPFDIASGQFQANIKSDAHEFYSKVFARLGWDKKRKEPENDAMLRSEVVFDLGFVGDEKILLEAAGRFKKYLSDEKSLVPDLRSAVYALAARNGDEKTYETLVELYSKNENAVEKVRLLQALASFRQKELLNMALEFALTPAVRNQDILFPIASLARNPDGKELIWPWIKINWPELRKRFGEGHNTIMLNKIISALSLLARPETEKEIKEFFEKNPQRGIEMGLAQTLERIRINHRFLEFNS